ncbi:MAG: protein kinase [Acidobacteriota bacterium]
MRRIIFLVFSICIFLNTPCWSWSRAGEDSSKTDIVNFARPALRVFTNLDGLPQDTIHAIAFDQKGYLWVGTEEGAAYYNGRWWTALNMPNQSVSNYIRTILTEPDGSFWFGKQDGGLSKLKNGEWITYDKDSGLPHNRVNCLLKTVADNGVATIWAGTHGGGIATLELTAASNNKWVIHDVKSGLPNNIVWQLLETRSENGKSLIWAATSGGLAKSEDGKWTVYNTKSGLPSDAVNSLLQTTSADGTRSLWVGTYGEGVARMDNESGKWTIFNEKSGLPNDFLTCLLETRLPDGTQTIWAGTFGGLARFENGKWTSLDTSSGLPSDQIYSLLQASSQDGTNTLWIGTSGGGVARLELGKWATLDTRSGLTSNQVNSFLEQASENGNYIYWIGTSNGLTRFADGKWTGFRIESGLPSNRITSLQETVTTIGKRAIWIGTQEGLALFENGKFTTFKTTDGLPNNSVYSLLETHAEDGTGILWVGTDGGLGRLEKGKWLTFNAKSVLPNNRVRCLLETCSIDGKRVLWVGTDGGLVRFQDDKWTIFDTKSGLPNNSILSLLQTVSDTGKSFLWVGTRGGISRLDLTAANISWMTLSSAETSRPVLPNNVVVQIREDKNKWLYLFTNKGIIRLIPHTPTATATDSSEYQLYNFTIEDGLPGNQCLFGASMVDHKGRIWAGMVGGAALFDPSKEREDHYIKPLHIERALLGGKEYGRPDAKRYSQLGQGVLELAYNENNISFEYALLSYFRDSDTHYQTHLIGLDSEPSAWVTDYKREFTTLPAGRYIFRVWGRDYTGTISGPAEFTFLIRPALWQRWWAYLIYLLSLSAIIYGGVRFRLRILEQRNRILEARVIERTNELAHTVEELQLSKQETEKKVEELAKKNAELIESHQRANRIFSALAEALPGTVLDGKYRIDDKIGAGGFGAVYRATHLAMKRPIAVKVFRPSPGNDSVEGLERFQQEAVSACRINHPNAVAVLDSGISPEGIAYLVMELLEGHPLTAELKEKQVLSIRRMMEIMLPICDVLHKAHSAGIVHRDIKPDNIFLHRSTEGEIVKVVDFGIAKLMDTNSDMDKRNLTATGGLVGTPVYMSPERLGHKAYDGRSDVYSLGVMLYEMLCGKPPFLPNESGNLGVMMKHMTQPPPPLRQFNHNIPEELEKVVMNALEKQPQWRPTARELAQELIRVTGIVIYPTSSGTYRMQKNIETVENRTSEANLSGEQATLMINTRTPQENMDTVEMAANLPVDVETVLVNPIVGNTQGNLDNLTQDILIDPIKETKE